MKVLVVEDNRVSRLTLVTYIRQMGYGVFEATDGEEGISLWEKEMPEFALVDWNMPKLSGIDMIKHIRDNQGNYYTYTIMITARDESDDLIVGFESGADDYLVKPIEKKELLLRMKAGERLLNLQSKNLMIFALANLAETRDKETGEHLDRIRTYSSLLAQAMAKEPIFSTIINRRFIDNIYDTSPLHDIGKVGIPDSILLKPDKLTREEFDVMQTHSRIGMECLQAVTKEDRKNSTLDMASEIAGYHHEKWDGSGYPFGLKGEEIPLSARIVALADVYDALRSNRVYKSVLTHKEVVEIILKSSNKHFDPRVVSAFMSKERIFERISNGVDN